MPDDFITIAQDPPEPTPQQSSWFVAPSETYDPRLLDPQGNALHADVRHWILSTVEDFLLSKGYRNPPRWLTVWVAGSGVTKQWAAHQGGAGDLDVLMGVNWPEFFALHPEWRRTPRDRMAAFINQQMHEELWLEDWHGPFGTFAEPFDVTFFINPQSSDIRDLKPYAAYNVSAGRWDVAPLELPSDWAGQVDSDWAAAIAAEMETVRSQIERYRSTLAQARAQGGPRGLNKRRQAQALAEQLQARWESLRQDRRKAFGLGGKGFWDFESYRWQSYKRAGLSKVLRAIAADVREGRILRETEIYGAPILGVDPARDLAARAVQRRRP